MGFYRMPRPFSKELTVEPCVILVLSKAAFVQAFIVAGGTGLGEYLFSVWTLLPEASEWTSLASLPRPLDGVRASILGDKMRLSGGYNGSSHLSEVSI